MVVASSGNENRVMSFNRALTAVLIACTFPTAFGATQVEKPFHSVSDADVAASHCVRRNPFTEKEMTDWLESQDHRDASASTIHDKSKIQANVFGIDLVDESPYRIKLLEALLTNESWSGEPQKTYTSSCHRTDCVVKELFGEKTGIQLLFMLGRFGFNGSHLRVKNADPWRGEELDTVLLSLSDLPRHLVSSSPISFNHQLVHFKRSEASNSDDGQPVSNATIFLFDHWSGLTVASQRYSLFHELGHNTGFNTDLDSSADWYRAAGWIDGDLEWKLSDPDTVISGYAETNPYEDFAESFAAYRYNPETLKKVSPKVYRFFKDKVFRGIEYTSEGACAERGHPPGISILSP
jgi:hypothetical protein